MARGLLSKNTNILLLFFLLVVVSFSVMAYTKSFRQYEPFISGVKACDRDNDCPDGYKCNTQTCVKTKEYNTEGYLSGTGYTTKRHTAEGYDQYSTEKLNDMPCKGDDECRSGTCLNGKCKPRNDRF